METVTATSLNSLDIVKLVLSTGVFTALINQGINWFRDWQKEKASNTRVAQYIALRIAVDLEAFAIACAGAISESDLHKQSNGHAGTPHSQIPHFPSLPTDVDWKLIETSLCSRILAFPNELKLRQSQIDSTCEFDCDYICDSFREQAGISGYYAWILATDLRKLYRLPSFDPKQISWDIAVFLKEINDKALEQAEASE